MPKSEPKDDEKPKKKTAKEWQDYLKAQQHANKAVDDHDFSDEAHTAKSLRDLHKVSEQTYRDAGGKL